MIDFFKSLIKPAVRPLNYMHISKKNILKNIDILQSYQKDSEIWPVLKSNAYGHGIKEISEILKKTKGKYICVDSFPEYQIVKKYSGKKVLVLGETIDKNYKYYDFSKATFCVYTLETVEFFISLKKKIHIHLFLNTGMNREGFQFDQLEIVLERLQNAKIIVEGVCSHFSSADEIDFSRSEEQINQFKLMYNFIESEGYNPKYRHISASSGTLKLQDSFFNAARPGMSVYGINVLDPKDEFYKRGEKLVCALDLYSTVIKKQMLPKGAGVSYNLTHITQSETKIAVIPFGYYEGLNRMLSNNYTVRIGKNYFPVRGRICMNMMMIEIGDKTVRIGDKVEIISKNKINKNTLYSIAEKTKTTPYEVTVKLQSNIHKDIV